MGLGESRRAFLKLLPLGVLAGVFASIGSAAFRFLRPKLFAATDSWLDVASVTELTGPQPISRKIVAEQITGWAITTEEHNVFVLFNFRDRHVWAFRYNVVAAGTKASTGS